jgi:hypothetical protein
LYLPKLNEAFLKDFKTKRWAATNRTLWGNR